MNRSYRKVLCATDLGAHCEDVLRAALRAGDEVLMLYVNESMDSFVQARMKEYLDDARVAQVQAEGRERIRAKLDAQLEEIITQDWDGDAAVRSRVSMRVRDGQAAQVILDVVDEEQADLVVLGRHGHSTLGELLIGSTAHRISQKSPVPVLLVPVSD